MNGNELISFQIISAVGTARSMYVEAIQEAKKGNIQAAKELKCLLMVIMHMLH